MYTMKDVCGRVGIPYETLRYYCNEGLVPNVERDKNNYRLFDEKNIAWLMSLQCLKRCGMSIKDMKKYLQLCLQGKGSVLERKKMLTAQRESLQGRIAELNDSIAFIDTKNHYFDNVLEGKIKYSSNLICIDE